MKENESNRSKYEGKSLPCTGATAGIGQAAAMLLAERGATVIGVGRNSAKNEYSIKLIKKNIAPRYKRHFYSTFSLLSMESTGLAPAYFLS